MNKQEIKELVQKMSLEEKVGMIHGAGFFKTAPVERLDIPAVVMSDGPMGVRKEINQNVWEDQYETEDFVSYFPSNTAIAATWNPECAEKAGEGIGREARGRGKDVILAPGINIIRTPLCGRNFEYMSEDPCLIAEMAVPFIRAVQRNDVSACVKHFALNNQEDRRMEIDVEADERALREIYLKGFEAAVKKAGVYSVMSAYNRFRGEYCSHHNYLLDDILRGEWKFDGMVISDWGAVHDTKKAAECSLDIEMSTEPDFEQYFMAQPLIEMVKAGEISEEKIDEKAERVISVMDKIGMFSEERKAGTYNHFRQHKDILDIAEESVVLLKNEGILPLKKEQFRRIAVIGENAQKVHAAGGGSAEIKALYEISPILGLKMALGGNTEVEYEPGYSGDASKQKELRERALRLAEQCDTVIYIGGLNHDYDSEGFDRKDMKLPYGQDRLISELLDVSPDTVIVMVSGAAVEMSEWIDKAKAVVQGWYAGMEGGYAIGRILTGEVNPSGKLPVTFPKKLEDSPAHRPGAYQGEAKVSYKEGVYVGYRYFDKNGIEPLFPFGHGLSYTEFSYDEADVAMIYGEDGKITSVRVKVKLTNCGGVWGAETVQVYMGGQCDNLDMPVKELKGFKKVWLNSGESAQVIIDVDIEECRSFDVSEGQFKLWQDEVNIMIGSSCRDIRKERRVCFHTEKMKKEKEN